MIEVNPFSSRGTVIEDKEFFIGRKNELQLIENRIFNKTTHTNISIVAEKRMGASSLVHIATNKKNEKTIIITIDISTIDKPQNLFYNIANQLYKRANISKVEFNLAIDINSNSYDLLGNIKLFFEFLNSKKIKAVCILEKFDYARKLFYNEPHYFQSLRELAYSPTSRISLITVSHRDIEKIEEQAKGVSNFHQIFEDRIYIKPFDDAQMQNYWQIFKNINIELTNEHKTKIQYYAGGSPYLLNILCFEIVENYNTTSTIDIKKAFNKVENIFESYSYDIIKHLKDEDRYEVLLKILKNELQDISKQQIKEFEKVGLIIQNKKEKYSLFSEYLDKIIKENTQDKDDTILKFEKDIEDISFWLTNNTNTNSLLENKFLIQHFPQATELQNIITNNFNDKEKIQQIKDDVEVFIDNKESILIKDTEVEPNETDNYVAISKIIIKNYYDLQNIEIKEIRLSTKWIFLTGENGFGKTLILQAIVAALNGERIEKDAKLIESDDFNTAISLFENHKLKLLNYRNPLFVPYKKFVAYGPYRLEIQNDSSKNEALLRSSQTYSIFHTDGVLLSIEREMLDLDKKSKEGSIESNERLMEIKNVFTIILKSYIKEIKTDGIEVKYVEISNIEHSFNQLSTGMKSIIAMIGDMIIRLFRENTKIVLLKDLCGIVIIDEIETHLHVKLQYELPYLLSQLFPKILFIASAHSPIPILGAPVEKIVLTIERETNDNNQSKLQVIKYEDDFQKLLPNALLTSDIFDLETLFSRGKSINEIVTFDNYKKHLKMEELKKRHNIIDLNDDEE